MCACMNLLAMGINSTQVWSPETVHRWNFLAALSLAENIQSTNEIVQFMSNLEMSTWVIIAHELIANVGVRNFSEY